MTGRGCLQEGTLLDGEVAASQPTSTAAAPTSSTAAPAFTLLPLGTGGGPFESDLSAYLLKPASSRWASGCISLEAGSGIGALAELLGKPSGHALWEQFELGPAGDHGEPWMAGKVMETMRSYLITHAHLDHTAALILGSGGLPPPAPPVTLQAAESPGPAWVSTRAVYAALETLVNLQSAFEERIWPSIAGFEAAHGTKIVRFIEIAPSSPAALSAPAVVAHPSTSVAQPSDRKLRSRKPASYTPPPETYKKQTLPAITHRDSQTSVSPPTTSSSSSLPFHVQEQIYTRLPTSPPISVLAFPISHGRCATARRGNLNVAPCCGATVDSAVGIEAVKGAKRKRNGHADAKGKGKAAEEVEAEAMTSYEASAFFVRLDGIDQGVTGGTQRREFCFFGDVEPDSISLHPRNRRVWEEVAYRFRAGILDSIFIECSYDNSRSDELLYGHLCPRHVLAELAILHELLVDRARSTSLSSAGDARVIESPSAWLRGLKVHIIHVKETLESLTADSGGIRGRVLRELKEGQLTFARGILSEVEFKLVKRGELLTI